MRHEYFTLGRVGLALSLLGFIGLCISPYFRMTGAYLSFLALPGIVFGTYVRFRGDRDRVGLLAQLIGIFTALFIPTLLLPF
jgi:hypothetical protein